MAPKRKDLIGQKFGRLTVISLGETNPGKDTKWYCNCDCGTKGILVSGNNLVRGHTKSCGCLKKEHLEKITINLIGQKFGKLTVKERADKKGKTFWKCDCDCGTKNVIASSSDLKNGDKISCGCIRREFIKSKDLTGQKFGRLTVIKKSDKRTASGDVYYVCDCDCGRKSILVSRSSLVAKDSHKQISCGCWVKEGRNSVNRENNREHIVLKYLYRKLQVRNKKLGFDNKKIISIEEFKKIIMQPCIYCGMENSDTTKEPYFYTYKKRNLDGGQIDYSYEFHHNGIDRIDNSIGYESGNIVPCCKYCNTAKSDRSLKDFLEWAEKAYNYFAKQHN